MELESRIVVLTGWKQIAGYLGCGTRTVQRWEKDGLPVHRVSYGRRSPVVADSEALKFWQLHGHPPHTDSPDRILKMREESQALRLEVQRSRRELRQKMARFHDQFGNFHKKLAADGKVKSAGQAQFRFLRVELMMAEAFCRSARQALKGSEKRERNRRNAREAYDTILRFMNPASLTAEENKTIDERLVRLRKELKQLGETF